MIKSENRFRIRFPKRVAKNATSALTAAELGKGIITSTSAAATSLTLPTGTLIGRHLNAQRGDQYPFVVDNSLGANIVTLVLATGIVVPTTVVITGSNVLTVAAAQVATFKLYFKSKTEATLFRTS